jgi:hypothetical protein
MAISSTSYLGKGRCIWGTRAKRRRWSKLTRVQGWRWKAVWMMDISKSSLQNEKIKNKERKKRDKEKKRKRSGKKEGGQRWDVWCCF